MKKRAVPLTLLASSMLLRVALIFRYRFDSDEPQHMHVAWGWAHGLMQYRDVFDNHMPLFHLLSAPLFAFRDDDPRLLFLARLSMVPLYVATLFVVWRIARELFDERTAWWSAVLVALFPPFFLGSMEYRTDDLWVVCWLGVIAVAITVNDRATRALAAGLLLGVAFGVSLKSVLLFIALALATVITALLTGRSVREYVRFGTIAAAAALVIPAGVAGGFAIASAWEPFLYGAVSHNRFPFEHAWRVLWIVPLYPIARFLTLSIVRSDADPPLVRRRLFVFLACASYGIVLTAFWPMLSMESYLPLYPLAILLVTPLIARRGMLIPALSAAAAIVVIIAMAKPWRNEAREEIELVTEVVSITEASDPVMDLKGESVFRARPYYLALEGITNVRMRFGLVRDDIADSLIGSATHVVVSDNLPGKARRFVQKNYVRWGPLLVSGVGLDRELKGDGLPVEFVIDIPGPYVILSGGRIVRATVDGIVADNGVHLAPGRHRVVSFDRAARPMVIWAGVLRSKTLGHGR